MKGVVSGIILTLLLLGFISFLTETSLEDVFSLSNQTTASIVSDYENITTHEGDLIIDGYKTILIENCTFIQKGNIYVDDYAKLIIRNTIFRIDQTHLMAFGITVRSWATLEMSNSIASEREFGLGCTDNSKISISNCSLHFMMIWGQGASSITINNCTADIEVTPTDNSRIQILNSSLPIGLSFDSTQTSDLTGLRPIYFDYWSLRQNQTVTNVYCDLTLTNTSVKFWVLRFNHMSKAVISNCSIRHLVVTYDYATVEIDGLRIGFHETLDINNIALRNTNVHNWALTILDSSVQIRHSESLVSLSGNSSISVLNSDKVVFEVINWFFGTILFNDSTLTLTERVADSDFYIHGNITQVKFDSLNWATSNVTRNYNIIAKDKNDAPVENVVFTLLDQNNTGVWNGITDSSGVPVLNLTYSDNNHTDFLKLRFFKEGFYNTTEQLSFSSSTPIIVTLTQKPLGDVNEDGVVNILDISLVARSFGCVQGDDRWNEQCDLNKDAEINIVDITLVAIDYGKSV